MKRNHTRHRKLHAAKAIVMTSLQVLALASLVRKLGPKRAAGVAATYLGRRH